MQRTLVIAIAISNVNVIVAHRTCSSSDPSNIRLTIWSTSTRPTPPFTPTCHACTEETRDNLPGPGRALDNLYQFLGRKLERWLGVIADKAGFGPAAGRRVEKAMKVIYDWDRAEIWRKCGLSIPVHWAKLRFEHVEVAKREVRQGCKALTKYSQCVSNVTNASLFFYVSPSNAFSILKGQLSPRRNIVHCQLSS